jgi:hypothetical protein
MGERKSEHMDYEYDEEGTLIRGEVIIEVCSHNKQGAVDPTTVRRYGLLCNNVVDGKKCHSKKFGEVPSRKMMVCKVCGDMQCYGIVEEEVLH